MVRHDLPIRRVCLTVVLMMIVGLDCGVDDDCGAGTAGCGSLSSVTALEPRLMLVSCVLRCTIAASCVAACRLRQFAALAHFILRRSKCPSFRWQTTLPRFCTPSPPPHRRHCTQTSCSRTHRRFGYPLAWSSAASLLPPAAPQIWQ